MADKGYQPPPGFMTFEQARLRLGVAKATVQRMVKDGRLRPYSDPRNKKVTLLRVEDVEALMRPRPREGEGTAVA